MTADELKALQDMAQHQKQVVYLTPLREGQSPKTVPSVNGESGNEADRPDAATPNATPQINDHGSQAAPRWIPVGERLPVKETPVLILREEIVRIGEIRWEYPTYEETFKAFQYWDDPFNDGQEWDDGRITHWMPLPTLPDKVKL